MDADAPDLRLSTPDLAPDEDRDDPVPGTLILGRYRVLRRIAQGAMGRVYLAEHQGLQRPVALKFLHDSFANHAEVAARFTREAIAAARLEHPHVIAVYDAGTDAQGRCFLAMEFFEGEELRTVLQGPPLPTERALGILRQVASAIDHAHSQGVVHRDIKPENILVQHRPDGHEVVKVIDFGIAKVYEPTPSQGAPLTRTGFVLGTPEYMAPEQALGADVDHRADLYAFAVVAYETLVGRRPFDSDDVMAVLRLHMTSTPPAPSSQRNGLPPSIDRVFERALAKTPDERFVSATGFVDALTEALTAPPRRTLWTTAWRTAVQLLAARARTLPPWLADRWRRIPPRRRLVVTMGCAALALVLAVGARLRPRPMAVTPDATHHPPRTLALPASPPRQDPLSAFRARVAALRARPDLPTRSTRERHRTALVLEAMRLQSPDDAAVAYVLGTLYAADRATVNQSVNAYRDALRVLPALADDEALVGDVVRIYATTVARSAPAEALLRGPLATSSLDALVASLGRSGRNPARVLALLNDPTFAPRLDATQRALVALASARTCEARRAAVLTLAQQGDARALPALRRIPTGTGCGFLGLGTCNGCLGNSVALAIQAIEARASQRALSSPALPNT